MASAYGFLAAKASPGGGSSEIRRHSRNIGKLSGLQRQCRKGGQKAPRIRMARIIENLLCRSDLHYFPAYMTATRSAILATLPRSRVTNTVAAPVFSRIARKRSRILDFTVNPAPSWPRPQRELGISRQRRRNNAALPHAAGQKMRLQEKPLCPFSMPTMSRSSKVRAFASSHDTSVPADHLHDLLSNGDGGIQRFQRILKDHGHHTAPDRAHLFSVAPGDVLPADGDLSAPDHGQWAAIDASPTGTSPFSRIRFPYHKGSLPAPHKGQPL